VTRWRWVSHGGGSFHDVGVNPDGSLYNPNGYPEDQVRAAVAAAEERRGRRRSEAAGRAARTRRLRRDRLVYQAVERLRAGGRLEPATQCRICGRGLADQESLDRGIGSECWQTVLDLLAAAR